MYRFIKHFLILFTFVSIGLADLILNEVMLSPETYQYVNEAIEIYNNGDDTIDISGYLILDDTEFDSIKIYTGRVDFPDNNLILDSYIIPPGFFAVILDKEYIMEEYDAPYDFPDSTIILTIDDYDIGNGLNNRDELLYLYDGSLNIVDSVAFGFSTEGYSFERISPFSLPGVPISDEGWQRTPADFHHTLGNYNSTCEVPNNISIDSLSQTGFSMSVHLSNRGSDISSSGFIRVDYHEICDSIFINIDIREIEVTNTDSIRFDLSGIGDGTYAFHIEIYGDMRNYDNIIDTVLRFGSIQETFSIREIMFKPLNGIEWVEYLNISSDTIDISNWTLGDASGVSIITDTSILIAPDEYMILAENIFSIETDDEFKIVIPSGTWRSLNNDGDEVFLFDAFNTVEYAIYEAESDFPAGYSIEIECESAVEASDPNVWEISQYNGGSAASVNSNCPQANDIAIVDVFVDSSGVDELHILLANTGFEHLARGTFWVFVDENFDRIASEHELLWPGQPVEVETDYEFASRLDLERGIHRLIIIITGDDRNQNNFDTLIYANEISTPIILTEFMNRPLDNEPEWIELYNCGEDILELINWSIGDGEDQKIIKDSIVFNPGQFLILSDTDLGGPEIADTCYSQLYIMDSWETLNNSDDKIVLIDDLGFERFSLQYDTDWTADCLINGLSIEMTSIDADPLNSLSWWCSKRFGGSPGCPPAEGESFGLSLSQKAFDPNFEKLEIDYSSPIKTSVRLRIYNQEGRLLKTLLDHDNPQDGKIEWDGKVKGKKLPIGMYIILADIEPSGKTIKNVIAIVRNVR